jgi:hypothetical protein
MQILGWAVHLAAALPVTLKNSDIQVWAKNSNF